MKYPIKISAIALLFFWISPCLARVATPKTVVDCEKELGEYVGCSYRAVEAVFNQAKDKEGKQFIGKCIGGNATCSGHCKFNKFNLIKGFCKSSEDNYISGCPGSKDRGEALASCPDLQDPAAVSTFKDDPHTTPYSTKKGDFSMEFTTSNKCDSDSAAQTICDKYPDDFFDVEKLNELCEGSMPNFPPYVIHCISSELGVCKIRGWENACRSPKP
jgi:hypothetical protein